jgi:hypothetical protein
MHKNIVYYQMMAIESEMDPLVEVTKSKFKNILGNEVEVIEAGDPEFIISSEKSKTDGKKICLSFYYKDKDEVINNLASSPIESISPEEIVIDITKGSEFWGMGISGPGFGKRNLHIVYQALDKKGEKILDEEVADIELAGDGKIGIIRAACEDSKCFKLVSENNNSEITEMSIKETSPLGGMYRELGISPIFKRGAIFIPEEANSVVDVGTRLSKISLTTFKSL